VKRECVCGRTSVCKCVLVLGWFLQVWRASESELVKFVQRERVAPVLRCVRVRVCARWASSFICVCVGSSGCKSACVCMRARALSACVYLCRQVAAAFCLCACFFFFFFCQSGTTLTISHPISSDRQSRGCDANCCKVAPNPSTSVSVLSGANCGAQTERATRLCALCSKCAHLHTYTCRQNTHKLV